MRELLSELKRRGIRARWRRRRWPNWVEALLKSTGLDGCFDVTVSSTAVENGKPAPDIFLHTAEKLQRRAGASASSWRTAAPASLAAKAAGMYAIQVRAASTALPPLPEADLVLESLSDFPLSLLD